MRGIVGNVSSIFLGGVTASAHSWVTGLMREANTGWFIFPGFLNTKFTAINHLVLIDEHQGRGFDGDVAAALSHVVSLYLLIKWHQSKPY